MAYRTTNRALILISAPAVCAALSVAAFVPLFGDESAAARFELANLLELKANRRVLDRTRLLNGLRDLREKNSVAAPIRLHAELEEIDLRLRLGQSDGLDDRLTRLAEDWKRSPSIRTRARTLRKVLQLAAR